jgi:hypothetical protein
MIHNPSRVEAIRMRAAFQLQLIDELELKIKEGDLPLLQVARNQLGDIERFFIAQLEKDSTRTLNEEGRWLDGAEYLLQAWTPELQKIKAAFDNYGSVPIQIIDG